MIPAVKPKDLGKKPLVMGTPKALEKPALVDTTPGPIGNAEVFEIQRKLEMLKLFTGRPSGLTRWISKVGVRPRPCCLP